MELERVFIFPFLRIKNGESIKNFWRGGGVGGVIEVDPVFSFYLWYPLLCAGMINNLCLLSFSFSILESEGHS